MIIRRRAFWSASAVVAFAVCGASSAAARCLPGFAPTIYVGDTTRDRACSFNTIQAAIDATVCSGTTIVVTTQLSYAAQRLDIAGKSDAVIDGCTFSLNSVGNNGPVMGASGALSITRTIFDQHEVGNLAYSGNPANLVVQYVMAITRVGLPAGPTVLFGQDPRFVSYDADDFHLQPTSPALDFAPARATDTTVDLDGSPRNQDLSTVANRFGTRDLGAYERQP